MRPGGTAPKDQRTISAYSFGAICAERGKDAGPVLPFCNTDAMSLHLAGISLAVAPGAHAVVLMDQAGWHMTGKRIYKPWHIITIGRRKRERRS